VLNVCDDKDKHFSKNETSSKLWHSRLATFHGGELSISLKKKYSTC
jgi:hypothetical protein